jgi:hypothetical protein
MINLVTDEDVYNMIIFHETVPFGLFVTSGFWRLRKINNSYL